MGNAKREKHLGNGGPLIRTGCATNSWARAQARAFWNEVVARFPCDAPASLPRRRACWLIGIYSSQVCQLMEWSASWVVHLEPMTWRCISTSKRYDKTHAHAPWWVRLRGHLMGPSF